MTSINPIVRVFIKSCIFVVLLIPAFASEVIGSCNVDPNGTYFETEWYTGSSSGAPRFSEATAISSYLGDSYLSASGSGATACPATGEYKEYSFNFDTTGTYKLWARVYATSGSEDSFFLGLDGTCVGSLSHGGAYNQWLWTSTIKNGTNSFHISTTGQHTINIWPREGGERVDAIYITQGSETPTDSSHGTEIDPSGGCQIQAPFKFISMADSRGNNNGVNDVVLSNIVDLILQEDAELVLFPGDLVDGSNTDSILTSQLHHWHDVMAPIYTSDMYGVKVYAGPGNHEMRHSGSEVVWQSIFSDLPSNGPTGETYMTYSFDYMNSHFVMLNTNRAGNSHTINYNWLANDLASTTMEHIFVFGHEPAFPIGPHLGYSLDFYPDQRDAFWRLLVDYDVDIYFAGHEHLYNHISVDGIDQIIVGTSGAPIYGGYGGEFYHYAVVTVEGPNVFVEIIDDSGVIRDSFDVFCLNDPVRIERTALKYPTLQEAYDAAANGDILQSQDTVFVEQLNIDQDKSVTIEGGYDCSYSRVIGITEIIGDMNVTAGTLTISDFEIQEGVKVSFGLISDLHYNDDPAYSYRISNLNTAVQTWNDNDGLSFAVDLGDFIHEVNATIDLESLATAEAAFQNFNDNVYGVIGNHHGFISVNNYLNASSIIPSKYYSFDTNGIHFIVLFASDNPFFSVDSTQLTWLENDLASSSLPKIVFSHQGFEQDYPGVHPVTGGPWCTSGSIPDVDCFSVFAHNSDKVRAILEEDGNVLAVFSGHIHIRDSRVVVNGIEHFSILGSPAYAIVHVSDSNNITVERF